MSKEIGTVKHWYGKIGVAVIDLKNPLKVGDKIKIKKGEVESEDVIASMQINHQEVFSADKGQEVAVKLSIEAKEGTAIYQA